MSDDEIIAVVQAHKEGKKIQIRLADGNWTDYNSHPSWNFSYMEYRVSPEPRKPREWLVYIGDDGTIMKDAANLAHHLSFPLTRVREVIE